MKFVIPGPIPSKKNSRNIFYREGKLFNTPNNKYTKWEERCKYILLGSKKFESLEKIVLKFWFLGNHRMDLTNKAESVMDLLVRCKIIPDDRWQITGEVVLVPAGIDKYNPRCEVTIFEKRGD